MRRSWSTLLGTIADRSRGEAKDAMTLLAGLADGLERAGRPLNALVASPPADLKAPLERLAPLWPIASTTATSSRPVPERLAALDVLARGRPDLAEVIIPGLLAADQPREIQVAAARAVARVGRTSLADKALDRWESLALATRRELLSAVAGNRRAGGASDPGDGAAGRSRRASSMRRHATASSAWPIPPCGSAPRPCWRSSRRRSARPCSTAISPRSSWPATLFAARPSSSRTARPATSARDKGNRVGPDLSGIAGRAPTQLLSDILDPNKNVEPDFIVLAAATRRGQVYSGLLAEETATTVKLRRAEGVEDTLLRSEIEEIRSTGQSLMPEGLEQNINPQEMADLIAFLRRGG